MRRQVLLRRITSKNYEKNVSVNECSLKYISNRTASSSFVEIFDAKHEAVFARSNTMKNLHTVSG